MAISLYSKRNSISILIISIALFLGSSLPANSTPIAGTPCTKLNSTKTASNIKYTCVKSGKKLIWNKGVALNPKPITSKSPDPIPSPAPTATQVETQPFDLCSSVDQGASKLTSKGTLVCKKDSNGKMRWLLEETISATTSSETIDPIRIAAFDSAHSYVCGNTHPNILFTREIGPTFPTSIADSVDKTLEHDFNCFSNFFNSQITLRIFYVNQSDEDFVYNKVIPSINQGDVEHIKSLMADMKSNKWGASGMAGGFVNWGKDQTYLAMVIHITTGYKWSDINNKLVTHEFTHVMQQAYRVKNRNSEPDGWYQQVPGYMTEGGADALGFTFEAKTVANLNSQIRDNANNMSRDPEATRFRFVSSETDMLERMKEVISPKNDGSYNMQYPVGAFIGEYIIGKYGFEKFLQLMKNFGVYQQFNENLIATLGITQDKLFSESVGYVFTQWKASIHS